MAYDTQMTTCERLKSGYAAAPLLPMYPYSVQPLPTAVPSSLATNLIDNRCGSHAFSPQLNRGQMEKFCGENPDPANVERAKSILRDHEKALIEAIVRLAVLSGSEDFVACPRHCYSVPELERKRTWM